MNSELMPDTADAVVIALYYRLPHGSVRAAPRWREAHHGYFCVRGDIFSFFAKNEPNCGDFVGAEMFMRFECNWGCQDKSWKTRRKWLVLFGRDACDRFADGLLIDHQNFHGMDALFELQSEKTRMTNIHSC
jgi:hypothetical protein